MVVSSKATSTLAATVEVILVPLQLRQVATQLLLLKVVHNLLEVQAVLEGTERAIVAPLVTVEMEIVHMQEEVEVTNHI